MKKIMFMLLMTGATVVSMAQTREIKGAVIDKNGNPLPGARVEATGGAENTVTDADGTFSLEVSQWLKSLTVSYPGMRDKKMNIRNKSNVLLTMHQNDTHWFANAIYQYDLNLKNSSVGIMGGQAFDKWGWFVKAYYDIGEIDDDDDENVSYYGSYYKNDDKKVGSGFGISGGFTKRIADPISLYFGLGGCKFYDIHHAYVDEEVGAIADLGIIAKFSHISANVGFSYRRLIHGFFDDDTDHDGIGIHVGVGYAF